MGKLSKVTCCVPGCKNSYQTKDGISFHTFPSEKETWKVRCVNERGEAESCSRRELWTKLLCKGTPMSEHARVCSDHFLQSDFCLRPFVPDKRQRRFIKKNAVPSQYLPNVSPTSTNRGKQGKIVKTATESDTSVYSLDYLDSDGSNEALSEQENFYNTFEKGPKKEGPRLENLNVRFLAPLEEDEESETPKGRDYYRNQGNNEGDRSYFEPICVTGVEKAKSKTFTSIEDKTLREALDEFQLSKDRYYRFGQFVAYEIRALSSDRLKVKLEREIQQAILRISEEDEQEHANKKTKVLQNSLG